mmetsp:Transcript_7365/g.13683  ORF Transcript_7365/g.13683 Transcript_7365/m.13683 type:complete len:147 (-) Transcript_7365:662-1102(-)
MASAIRDKRGIVVGAAYTREEVRRPITSRVVVEKVDSLPGSTAGAGSGDFHQYRNIRRREMFRLEMMEKDYKEAKEKEEFEIIRAYNQKKTEKANKKADKRRRRKLRRQLKDSMPSEEGMQSDNEESGGECDKRQKIEETECIDNS